MTSTVQYAAMGIGGSMLLSGISGVIGGGHGSCGGGGGGDNAPPGDGGGDFGGQLGNAARNFAHGAGDVLHFITSLPGDIRHGAENAANTMRNVTYLVAAGAIITGAIYAYRH